MVRWIMLLGLLFGCSSEPTDGLRSGPEPNDDARWLQGSIAVANHVCGIVDDGQVACTNGGRVEGIDDAVSLRMGSNHGCAITREARVACWGRNAAGELGRGMVSDDISGADLVVGLEGVVDLSVGSFTSCAVTDTKDVYCWGQRLDDTREAGPSIVRVSVGEPVVSVGVGWVSACALTERGAVYCWGRNVHGIVRVENAGDAVVEPQLIDETAFDAPITKLYVGPLSACADDANGALYCWGSAGSFSGTEGRAPPTRIDAAPHDTVDIGYSVTCVLGDTPHCSGVNLYEQLGSTAPERISPEERFVPPDCAQADAISAGHVALCGRFSDEVRCSGYLEGTDLSALR